MTFRKKNWLVIAALALCATASFAQDQKQGATPPDQNTPLQPLGSNTGTTSPNQPIGAARGVNGPSDSQSYDPSQVTPDANTLAGATPFTLGSLQHNVNVFDPAISATQLGEYVPGTSGQNVLTGVTIVGGSLNFSHTWREYRFSALYNGGETFNEGIGAASTFFGNEPTHFQFHNLAVAQEMDWARWRVLLQDNFAASPGATFTSQGMGGPGLAAQLSSMIGSSLNSLSQSFLPSENINTGYAMRYMNGVLGQAEYSISRRSSITFSGSYGLLHFTGAGYINSTEVNAQAGYDYQLDPSDSFAFLGSFGRINYTGTGNSTTDYVGALAYGRKITGRLSFQVSGGPQEIQTAGPGAIGNFHQLSASINSTLNYARRRSSVSLTYARGLTSGSGVFEGATSNTVKGQATYKFTRFWTGAVNAGYSLDNSLAPAGTASTQFDNWFAGANLGRQIGPYAQINFNYGATRQNNPATCPVVNCGGNGLQQTFGMTVNWHLLPVRSIAR
jgi:hypothetical protein